MTQNKLKLLLFILVSCFLSACTIHTETLWKTPETKEVVYVENISHFLITEDGEKIVIIGDKYHYVFPNQNDLANILKWSDRKLLSAKFHRNFNVDTSNQISGDYLILCDNKELTKEQEQWLWDNGFVIKVNDGKAAFVLEKQIHGKRYLSKEKLNLSKYAKLNKEYKITIYAEKANFWGNKWVKAAQTPITVAEDGLATIALSPLIAIALPIALYKMPRKDNQ